jgi:hypothetical protein
MSKFTTTNETSNVTSLPSTSKAQTAKEVIATNVKLLIEQLEAGHSEGLTAYLTAMGKGVAISFLKATGFRTKAERMIFDIWCGDAHTSILRCGFIRASARTPPRLRARLQPSRIRPRQERGLVR